MLLNLFTIKKNPNHQPAKEKAIALIFILTNSGIFFEDILNYFQKILYKY